MAVETAFFMTKSLIGAAIGLIFRPKTDKITWFYRLLDHFRDPTKMMFETLLKRPWKVPRRPAGTPLRRATFFARFEDKMLN